MLSNSINKFSEALILCGHKDIVRVIAILDENRFCTGGDDGLVITWNIQTGDLVYTIEAHTRPLTGICVTHQSDYKTVHTENTHVVTTSSDKVVKVWNAGSGDFVRSFDQHKSTVKCVVGLPLLNRDIFCTGGEKLCLWSSSEGLLCQTDAIGDDAIHLLCVLDDNSVLASSGNNIVLYHCVKNEADWSLESMKFLGLHKESVLHILCINEDCFLTGSLDGSISLYRTSKEEPIRNLGVVENYAGERKDFPLSVHCLVCIDQKFILASKGCGFAVYNMSMTEILDMPCVHESTILGLTVVHDNQLLVTSSEDGSIKLWGFTETIDEVIDASVSNSENMFDVDNSRTVLVDLSKSFEQLTCESDKRLRKTLELITECTIHSGPVNSCVAARGGRLVSCGGDHLVIVWQSRAINRSREDKLIRDALFSLILS